MPVFNSLWVGEVNDLCRLCIASYVAQGHSFRLWSYNNLYIPGATSHDASEIVDRQVYEKWQKCNLSHRWQTFANYFRFKLIHKYGGWWADLDSVAIKPHEFDADYVFSSIHAPTRKQLADIIKEPHGNISNGCFKAPKGAPFLSSIVNRLDAEGFNEAACPDFAVWGVVAFTRAIYEHDLLKYKWKESIFFPIPPTEANRLFSEELPIPEWAYSIHFYNWITNKNQERGGVFRIMWNKYFSQAVL